MKTTVVRPLGVLSQPNKYGQYPPGALRIAKNVAMRDPGVLSSMPGLQTLRSNAMPNGDVARRIWAGDAYQLVASLQGSTWTLKWVDGASATTIASPALFSHAFGTGIAPIVRQRGRVIAGTSNGPVVLDSEGDTTAREVGLAIPAVYPVDADVGMAILAENMAAYVATFRRKFTDGYEINGPFSTRYVVNNSNDASTPLGSIGLVSPAADYEMQIAIEDNSSVVVGDLCELYRTKGQPSGVDPGDTYYLAKTVKVTSADITAGFVSITDDVPDAQLGVEAYVNPGQLSISKNKTAPPIARDIVMHQGHALYLGTTTPAALTSYVAGAMTSTSGVEAVLVAGTLARRNGLGVRGITGDLTLGSPIIANISADDMVGLAVGQQCDSNQFDGDPLQLFVTAVGATSITLNQNASATVPAHFCETSDYMTVDGYKRPVINFQWLHGSLTNPTFWSTVLPTIDANATMLVAQTRSIDSAATLSGFSFSITRPHAYAGAFTIQASNGQNYQPPIATYSDAAQTVAVEQRLNRVHWSEVEQPEAVPLANYFYVGSGEIYRGVSVGGMVLVFASDGLWQISGDGNGWRVLQLDPSLILAARGAVAVMDGFAYAHTNRGLVSVSPDGAVTELSSGKIGQPAGSTEGLAPASYSDTWATYLVCDELHHEVLLTVDSGNSFFVYNTRSGAFTTFEPTNDATATAYSRALASLVFATATSGGPSVEYFRADSSNTRLAGADVLFQPLVGPDPSMTKEWIDIELAFEGVVATISLVPKYDLTSYTAVSIPANFIESRVIVPVPRNAPALSARLAPGFTFASGDTTSPWSLRMMAVTYELAMQEAMRR